MIHLGCILTIGKIYIKKKLATTSYYDGNKQIYLTSLTESFFISSKGE
jgi:hypothetical protein